MQASEVWNALNVAERRALLEAKKDQMGMTMLLHRPATMLAFWANRNAAFKSALAKTLYAGSEQIPATGARLGVAGAEAITQNQ